MAKEDLDLVICLGDYIYEHMYYDGPADRVDRTGPNNDGDVQTLAEFREKYHFYQADKDLQDAARRPPLGDDLGRPRGRGQLRRRRGRLGAARSAPGEQRLPAPGAVQAPAPERLQGVLRGASPAAPQGDGEEPDLRVDPARRARRAVPHRPAPVPRSAALQDAHPRRRARRRPSPGRTMLGAEQKKWFKKAVPDSNAKWKLWASELMVMSVDVPARARRRSSTPGTATRPSAARSSSTSSRRAWRTSSS